MLYHMKEYILLHGQNTDLSDSLLGASNSKDPHSVQTWRIKSADIREIRHGLVNVESQFWRGRDTENVSNV